MKELIDQYERQQQRRKAQLPKYKAALLKALRKANAAEATIEYDGEGDSGQIEDVRFLDSGGILIPDQPLPGTTKRLFSQPHFSPQTLREALDAFAWELLAVYHDGFENNEGAFGIVTIDVAKKSVVLEHSARIADVFTTTTEV
jgi:uncharacterized protein DUF6878